MKGKASTWFNGLFQIDWWLVGPMIFLIGLGLVIQYSIGLNQEVQDFSQFSKQIIFAGTGLLGFILLIFIDHRIFRSHPFVYMISAFVILVLVLLFGTTIKGTTGWFLIGSFSFQPVELIKLLFLLFMATYLEKDPTLISQSKFFIISGFITAVFVGLILLQPDTGSAFIIFSIWFFSVIFLKAQKKWILLVVVAVIASFLLGWFFLFPDYQKARLSTFINPEADPLGNGYNLNQAIVAVGSGSLWGSGLGLGTQSQLHFLPEVSSDFIFAVVAEELGFIGVLATLAAFMIILFRLWRYLINAKDGFSFVFTLGSFVYLFVQSIMVIGMNIGLLPITGLPLPLVSAGGSSMLITLAILGINHNIGLSSEK